MRSNMLDWDVLTSEVYSAEFDYPEFESESFVFKSHIRVLKIWTWVRLEYTVRLKYYITDI